MIFNSLGSNYNLSFAINALFSPGSQKDLEKLENFLSEKYSGKTYLFYKGREALTAALEVGNLKGYEIAVNGFTCLAVLEAVKKAGCIPVPLDLEEAGGLNFTAKVLEKALSKNKKIKAVIIQNTLGYPCEIEQIEKLCKKNNLTLIEDLAHCVGSTHEDGREAGTVGDFSVLSFSQDKIIDAISGGALIIKNKNYQEVKLNIGNFSHTQTKDRLYPIFTYKIRHLYSFGLGKPFHFVLKKLSLLSNIMDTSYYEYGMLPFLHAKLALNEFRKVDKQLKHRREITKIYVDNLPDSLFMYGKEKMLKNLTISSNLRFPIFTKNRQKILLALKRKGIFLSDIWYVDIDSSCPSAVKNSKIILNLPTHINVSHDKALQICEIIKINA